MCPHNKSIFTPSLTLSPDRSDYAKYQSSVTARADRRANSGTDTDIKKKYIKRKENFKKGKIDNNK